MAKVIQNTKLSNLRCLRCAKPFKRLVATRYVHGSPISPFPKPDRSSPYQRWYDYRELFNTRAARHRSFLVLCIGFFGQIDLPPTSYYMPLMAKNAGVTSTKQQLLLNALQSPVMTIGTLLGVRFIDKAGRRPMLMGSSSICSFCVLMVIICSAKQNQVHRLGLTGISFVYVFLFAFAFVWTPCQALYPSEVLAYNARAKGLAMSGLWLNIVSFINTYAAPVGITNAGWKFYILYLAVDMLGILFIYLFFVETKVWNSPLSVCV